MTRGCVTITPAVDAIDGSLYAVLARPWVAGTFGPLARISLEVTLLGSPVAALRVSIPQIGLDEQEHDVVVRLDTVGTGVRPTHHCGAGFCRSIEVGHGGVLYS